MSVYYYPVYAVQQTSASENKIIIYSEAGFNGRITEFKKNVLNLEEKGITQISSFQIIGAPWVVYFEKNYTGNQMIFEEGDYPSYDKGRFLSMKIITEDLGVKPEIQIFEDTNYGGKSVTLQHETNLHNINFGDTASSHKVISGTWVLYEHVDRQGKQLLCLPGQEVPNYCEIGFNDVISHVRPLVSKS
ncbi:epidermal differentiation-specific protein-like [Misgurnus anguillicaudatus]|uniref:epidermal differentiation-specific protein-like n=1 Tax=Misgurnus anguillicaudatus TaxID=75329 RepID=UPI003CCF70F5